MMTGWWSNVAIVSYAVPSASVAAFMPKGAGGIGLELETSPFEQLMLPSNKPAAVISVVAQESSRVRLMGIQWPWHNKFTSFYLRLLVKQGPRRGVVYIREIVPKPLLAWGGRTVYNQPCVCAPTETEIKQQMMLLGVEHRIRWPEGGLPQGGCWNKADRLHEQVLRVVGTKPPQRPGPNAIESWITQRPLVFGMDKQGHGLVYELIHPSWGAHAVVDSHVQIDFGSVFGSDFGFLNSLTPGHVMLGVGSEVAIFPKRKSAVVRWGERR